ncbi:hypothetical protein B0H14DRAFT_2538910 [Mycena olivaceomarginata]|nr:hypothetical protein B0H14DRAFT_2538910 [Mycena olivaceomarginata]
MPSPGHIALVTGLVSTSYFTFGNIGAAYFGIMPLTARGQTTLSVPDRLALWDTFYSVAKVHMASSTITAGLSLSVSSYLTPAGSLRNFLAAGAVSGFTVAIFTVLFMLPLNNGLLAISRANSGKPMEEKQQQYVLAQLDQWRALHRVRMALGIISWLASTTALLASDPIIQF